MTEIEWTHNKIFHDWTLDIPLPNGRLRATISFTNFRRDDHSTWGTIESFLNGERSFEVVRYNSPPEAVEVISRSVVARLVKELFKATGSQPPELS